jgi:flagellin-like protein
MVLGSWNRRGMSPLIATILLMAFAVALGGMIMNWSIDVSINGDCDKIALSVTQFCSDEGTVVIRGANAEESVPLEGLQVVVSSGNVESVVNIKDSAVSLGQRVALNLPVAIPSGASVSLLGIVGDAQHPFVCEEPIRSIATLEPC